MRVDQDELLTLRPVGEKHDRDFGAFTAVDVEGEDIREGKRDEQSSTAAVEQPCDVEVTLNVTSDSRAVQGPTVVGNREPEHPVVDFVPNCNAIAVEQPVERSRHILSTPIGFKGVQQRIVDQLFGDQAIAIDRTRPQRVLTELAQKISDDCIPVFRRLDLGGRAGLSRPPRNRVAVPWVPNGGSDGRSQASTIIEQLRGDQPASSKTLRFRPLMAVWFAAGDENRHRNCRL